MLVVQAVTPVHLSVGHRNSDVGFISNACTGTSFKNKFLEFVYCFFFWMGVG